MKRKRKIILLLSVAILLIGTAVGVTIAYFTANQQANNDVTIGENTIEIVEKFDPPKKQEQENEFLKSVLFKNTGNIPCYIRAKLEFSSSEIMDLSELSAKGTDEVKPGPTDYVSAKDYSAKISEHTSGDWIYKDDGYYYYTKAVAVDKSTSNLVRWVKTNYGEKPIQRYDIIVYAESVQIYGKNGEEYSYAEAWENFK